MAHRPPKNVASSEILAQPISPRRSAYHAVSPPTAPSGLETLETSRQRLFAPMIEDVVKLVMKTSKA